MQQDQPNVTRLMSGKDVSPGGPGPCPCWRFTTTLHLRLPQGKPSWTPGRLHILTDRPSDAGAGQPPAQPHCRSSRHPGSPRRACPACPAAAEPTRATRSPVKPRTSPAGPAPRRRSPPGSPSRAGCWGDRHWGGDRTGREGLSQRRPFSHAFV